MRLKDKEGHVVEVGDNHYTTPNKDGEYLAPIGGFSYFWGVPTEEPITHEPLDHPDLLLRGELVSIDPEKRAQEVKEMEERAAEAHRKVRG